MKNFFKIILSIILLGFLIFPSSAQAEVRIQWFGQACFLLTSPTGVKILIDPFGPGLGYPLPSVSAELVLISHEHFDHNNPAMAKGNPKVIHGLNPTTGKFVPVSETIQGIKLYSVKSFHDDKSGKERGENAIMVLEMSGIRLVHLGDLGTVLNEEQIQKIGTVDVLMIPVGGTYTINAEQANKVIEQLKPKLIFPMHYKTSAISLPLSPLDNFLAGKSNVEKVKGNEYVIKELPASPKIIVLDWK